MKEGVFVKKVSFMLMFGVLLSIMPIYATPAGNEKKEYAQRVKQAFLKAWKAYKDYAWGEDAVSPIAKRAKTLYYTIGPSYNSNSKKKPQSLMMTPIDAFSTMCLMDLEKEKDEVKELLFNSGFTFDMNMEVQQFEIGIRLLGGLLSAYQLDGDKRFLVLATDLGDRLLPVFDTPTGIPYRFINLRTGEKKDPNMCPCEIGSTMLEFGILSKLTGNPIYYNKAKKGIVEVYKRRGKTGLVGDGINADTGEWYGESAHISARIDAYYEYLIKAYILFGDEDFKIMWETFYEAVNKYVGHEVETGYWMSAVNMHTGKRERTTFGALDCFWAGSLALQGDRERAGKLGESIWKLWNVAGGG